MTTSSFLTTTCHGQQIFCTGEIFSILFDGRSLTAVNTGLEGKAIQKASAVLKQGVSEKDKLRVAVLEGVVSEFLALGKAMEDYSRP